MAAARAADRCRRVQVGVVFLWTVPLMRMLKRWRNVRMLSGFRDELWRLSGKYDLKF